MEAMALIGRAISMLRNARNILQDTGNPYAKDITALLTEIGVEPERVELNVPSNTTLHTTADRCTPKQIEQK